MKTKRTRLPLPSWPTTAVSRPYPGGVFMAWQNPWMVPHHPNTPCNVSAAALRGWCPRDAAENPMQRERPDSRPAPRGRAAVWLRPASSARATEPIPRGTRTASHRRTTSANPISSRDPCAPARLQGTACRPPPHRCNTPCNVSAPTGDIPARPRHRVVASQPQAPGQPRPCRTRDRGCVAGQDRRQPEQQPRHAAHLFSRKAPHVRRCRMHGTPHAT